VKNLHVLVLPDAVLESKITHPVILLLGAPREQPRQCPTAGIFRLSDFAVFRGVFRCLLSQRGMPLYA
jgi:hypothetical protein